MKVKHPLAGEGDGVPSSAVDVNGENVPVDDDGTFDVGGHGAWVSRFADAHDVDREDILVDDSTTDQGDEDSETSAFEEVDPPFDPGEYTVDELDAHLKEIADDLGEKEAAALYEAEEDGKDRDTALDTIVSHVTDAIERHLDSQED